MIILLKKAVKNKIINLIDFYFSQLITKKNNAIMLVAACVSCEHRNGRIFLPIEYFEKKQFFSSLNKKFIKKILDVLGKKINWTLELIKHSSVSNGSIAKPLVLFEDKIYLYKIWKSQKNIFRYLSKKNNQNTINKKKCVKILEILFPEKNKNMQKIAVALTLINQITFIIGGPGTGKTTTILKIIIALIKNSKKNIKIQLSAPTGKATTRLNQILKNNLLDCQLNAKEKKYIAYQAVTIHQLLGIQKISQKTFFNKKNLLDLDVLIIDETSMIDMLTMEKIFFATSESTKIIFIGDYNQLCPIESVSILKELCHSAKNQYSLKLVSLLEDITNFKILNHTHQIKQTSINDNICILKKNYRFNDDSGIYILSHAIKNNIKKVFVDLFNNIIKDVTFYETNNNLQYTNMIDKIVIQYQKYWNKIHNKRSLHEIMETFQNYQVLCIVRDGFFGVNFLNKTLEENMYQKNIIKYFYINEHIWYVGKPIIITNNNQYLELYNGDIGITNINNQGNLQVSFINQNNLIRNFPINIIRDYETAWVITVHKGQGSEFINTALILPNFYSQILKKDMLYTGITRCRKRLDIFSNKKIFLNALLKNS